MNINDKYVHDIGVLILQCEKVISNPWNSLSVVYDTGEGHTANSGFLYTEDSITPISVSIAGQRLLLRNKILEFRNVIFEQTGDKFKQLLIQMEKDPVRVKIDYEFDDQSRWSISPRNRKTIREELRPRIDNGVVIRS
jgi:hypothetical protein